MHAHLDVLQEDPPSSLVLEGQKLLSVLPLLIAVLLEEMSKALEGDVIPGEVERLGGQIRGLSSGAFTPHYLATTGSSATRQCLAT